MAVELDVEQHGLAADAAWRLVRAAADLAGPLDREGVTRGFVVNEHGELVAAGPDDPQAALVWRAGHGWELRLPPEDARSAMLSLYLPFCSATPARPITIGHLGQSLDGFIATPSGDSQFVTGDDNVVHMHRLRALCDAIVVGAGTVAADDPRLTTRRVAGPNPLRVIVDLDRRLDPSAQVFVDGAAPTLYYCSRTQVARGETHVGAATIVPVDATDLPRALAALVQDLRLRECARVFVEGGGVTVSAFLEAGLLDCLQITIAPVLIGDGRPAIRLAPVERLSECRRPAYRVFRMGGDVLFDCALRSTPPSRRADNGPPVTQVI